MRSLAIIPARRSSRRIPRKNLERVGRHSLLERAVRAGIVCERVVVSTDDPDAMDEAERLDVEYVARKPEHATDDAQLEPVIADVLAQFTGYGAIVLLQPTSPFRTSAHVVEALELLETTGCDSVVSVTRSHSHYPAFCGELYDGVYYPRKPNMERLTSSALEHLCHENGAIYAFTREHFERTGSRMGGDMRGLVMHWSDAVDIDTPEDLEAARRMAR